MVTSTQRIKNSGGWLIEMMRRVPTMHLCTGHSLKSLLTQWVALLEWLQGGLKTSGQHIQLWKSSKQQSLRCGKTGEGSEEAGLDSVQVLHFHDEFERETLNAHVDRVKEIAVKAFDYAGKYFKLNVPLVGDVKSGPDWNSVH